MKSTKVTPSPTIDTSPPLPAVQADVLTATPPSETTAVAEAEAEAEEATPLAPPAPEGEPVLVGRVVLPVAVACGPPPVVLGALPLPP